MKDLDAIFGIFKKFFRKFESLHKQNNLFRFGQNAHKIHIEKERIVISHLNRVTTILLLSQRYIVQNKNAIMNKL